MRDETIIERRGRLNDNAPEIVEILNIGGLPRPVEKRPAPPLGDQAPSRASTTPMARRGQ